MLSGERLLKRLRHYPDIPACGRAVPRTKYPRTLQKGTGIFRSRSRLFLEGLFFLWVLHYFFGPSERRIDIRADVFLAQQGVESRFVQDFVYFGIDARKDDAGIFLLRYAAEVREVMDARRVDEGDLSHTDDPHLCVVAELHHLFLEFVGDAEEVGTVDFIYFDASGDDEVLFVRLEVRLLTGVYFVADDRDVGSFHHAPHEEQAGEYQSDFDGHRQVDDDRQQEGDQQHRDIRAGILHQSPERAPFAHVVRYHYQHACQAGHWDILRQRHQEQEDQQQYDGMDDACDRRAAAVVDIGHLSLIHI